MMSAAVPKYSALDLYAETFAAAERAMDFWSGFYRTSADLALWWADRWMQLPLTALTFLPQIEAEQARGIIAEAAEATAATLAAPVLEALKTLPDAPAPPAMAAVEAPAEAAEAVIDDLTRLVGIGPRVAALLAERGVTRFAQIAAWSEEEAARVDRELNLMGRVTREAWVKQARQFTDEA